MEQLETGTFKTLQAPKKSKHVIVLVLGILDIILLALSAWLGWQWYALQQQHQSLLVTNTELSAHIVELTKKINTLEGTPDESACDGTVSNEIKTTIRSAVESHNFAPLETYITNPVPVIIAASDGVGDRTPAQAITDLAYVNSGTLPWDFNLPAATLSALDAGFYTDYFDTTTYVGKASNNMVVAFNFDDCGKINQIFMAASIDLLL